MIKIILCVKPVREKYIKNNTDDKWCINPYDLYALKCALSLKAIANIQITCISMGPDESIETLIKCITYGADEAVLLSDHKFARADTFATTYVLAKAINYIGNYDLIVCGNRAVDGETGQVPYGLAERLDILCVPCCKELLSVKEKKLVFKRDADNLIETIESTLPIVLSFSGFTVDEPKTNLRTIKNARSKIIPVWNAIHIGADINLCGNLGSKTKVIDLEDAFPKRTPVVIDGNCEDIAYMIYEKIKEQEKS